MSERAFRVGVMGEQIEARTTCVMCGASLGEARDPDPRRHPDGHQCPECAAENR